MLFRRKEIWMVLFYNPSCKPCQEVKPVWIELADKLYGVIKVAAVNCAEEEELCDEFDIKSFPTIMYFPENTAKSHEKYTGKRTYKDISEFAVSKMQSFVRVVTDANFAEFEAAEMPKIILFTDKKTTPPILKALSKQFKDRVMVGECRSSNLEMVSRFGITEFPSVIEVSSQENKY